MVQALLSLQVVPFGAAGFEQTPVVGLQVPATWHWSEAVQVTGVPGAQEPFWQVSAPLQRLPSEQLVPFAAGACEHSPVVASQLSTVHGLPSSQLPADEVHWPFEHIPVPQTAGPVHIVPFGAFMRTQPEVGLHDAAWQEFGLVQMTGVPPVQTPI